MVSAPLRTRFVVAAGLLVLTTITASVWTFFALTRLSSVVTDTVRQSEAVTAVTSRLAGALEREDDAVLLILAGEARGRQVLADERSVVDAALRALFDVLDPKDERELARPLDAELRSYRGAADAVVAVAAEREALVQYHQQANPVLRRAVALITGIRDRHFELAREAVAGARDEAAAARRIVLLITLAALGIAIAVAWHLTRTVVSPVRQLTRGANAIRRGDFSERIELRSRDELGELAGALNQMAEDLAEFRRTNIGEVVRAKNTLEATLEALPDAVVLLDAGGHIQSMNRAAVNALAAAGIRNPHRLADLRLVGLDHAEMMHAMVSGRGELSTADLSRTIRLECDGRVQRLLPRIVPVTSTTPDQGGAVLLLYDVTDLVRIDELRSELVAVASHELQTPLTTLRMALLMLKETAGVLPERHRELVDTSLIGVEQLHEVVYEFLDLTRIEAGELRLNVEPIDVDTILAETLRRVDGQAKAQRIEIRRDTDGRAPILYADPVRLRSVFANILSNSLKYTAPGGVITVSARPIPRGAETAEGVSITIADTGIGIPEAFHARVFDKFFRLEDHHTASRAGVRGAGIGLYMSRQIVELHGGTITCAAGPNGQGTCITVVLPTRHTLAASLITDSATHVVH